RAGRSRSARTQRSQSVGSQTVGRMMCVCPVGRREWSLPTSVDSRLVSRTRRHFLMHARAFNRTPVNLRQCPTARPSVMCCQGRLAPPERYQFTSASASSPVLVPSRLPAVPDVPGSAHSRKCRRPQRSTALVVMSCVQLTVGCAQQALEGPVKCMRRASRTPVPGVMSSWPRLTPEVPNEVQFMLAMPSGTPTHTDAHA
ncbi:Unknown protein, partial [Striga hermonthica]